MSLAWRSSLTGGKSNRYKPLMLFGFCPSVDEGLKGSTVHFLKFVQNQLGQFIFFSALKPLNPDMHFWYKQVEIVRGLREMFLGVLLVLPVIW